MSRDMPRKRKLCDRTLVMHGALIVYWLRKGRKFTTSQWAAYLQMSNQGVQRIFKVLRADPELSIGKDEDLRDQP